VNAAATLVALDERLRKDTKIRVNGDDIAFIADQAKYEYWKQVTSTCGLDFSLGKNYTSRDFIIMNSELRRAPKTLEWEVQPTFTGYEPVCIDLIKGLTNANGDGSEWDEFVVYDAEYRYIPWRYEGFLNQSLLYNRVKKGQDAGLDKDTYWYDLSDISKEMLRGISSKYTKKFYGVFFKTYESQIREAPKGCQKWFPKELGGMGLNLGECSFEEMNTAPKEILDLQLKQAAFLACNDKKRLSPPTYSKDLFGALNELVRDVRSLGSRQVRELIKEVPQHYERKPLVGGTLMLGYLLGVSHCAGGDLEEGFYRPWCMGGTSDVLLDTENHEMQASASRHRYQRWLHGSLEHSLSPMSVSKCLHFEESKSLVNTLDVVGNSTGFRQMD
jgi:hypothetical protein